MSDGSDSKGAARGSEGIDRRSLIKKRRPRRYCPGCQCAMFEAEARCESCHCSRPPEGWPELVGLNDPWLGRVIADRYFIARPLGHGTSGRVYRGESLSISREFAVKVIETNKDRQQAEKITQRLEREIEALSRLRNPHIVSFYEFFDLPGGSVAAVMDLIEGTTLETLILDGPPLDIERACSLLRQTANGIYEAHEAGMIHRDLKPENLMVERLPAGDDFVHILDFGIVRLNDDQRTKLTQGFIGTPLYASPEQAQGKDVDHRSDIYSLGAILFFMLTGRPPFPSDNVYKVLRQHVRKPPPRLSEVSDRSFPVPLEELVSRMLAKRAADRPDDLSNVIEDLDRLEASRRSGTYDNIAEDTRRTLQAGQETKRQTPRSGIIKVPDEFRQQPEASTESGEFERSEDHTSSGAVQRHRSDTPSFQPSATPTSSPTVEAPGEEIAFSGSGNTSSAATAISSATYHLQSAPGRIGASYHPADGRFVILEGSTDELLLFEPSSPCPSPLELSITGRPRAATLSSSHLFVGDEDGNICQLRLGDGDQRNLFQDVRRAPITALTTDTGHNCIVAGSRSGRVYINHRQQAGASEWKRFRNGDAVQTVTINNSTDTVAIARCDNSVEIVGVSNPRVPTGQFDVDAPVRSMAVSPDDYLLAAALADRSIALYQLPTGRKMLSLTAEHVDVLAVEFNAEGEPVTICSIDGRVQLLKFDQIGSEMPS